ncbi:MAG: hypothetical protein R3F60_05800 [bacterium]
MPPPSTRPPTRPPTPRWWDSPFPGGLCFDPHSNVFLATAVGDTHAPRGLCTPWAIAWTQGRPGGAVLRLLTREGQPTDAVDGPQVASDTPLASDGRFLVVLGPWPAPGGPLTALRLDLTQPEVVLPLSLTGRPHRDVARAPGMSGHVEADADESWVVLTTDDDRFESCRQPGRRQWGLALGSGRAAWFERQAGRTVLVVTEGIACGPSIRRPVDVADGARLALAGGGIYWIERSGQVLGLVPDGRGRLRPVVVEGDGAGVELAGGEGPWLAVVRYTPGRYTLDLMSIELGARRAISSASARRPALSAGWLLWAEAAVFVPWELRYVHLATLR